MKRYFPSILLLCFFFVVLAAPLKAGGEKQEVYAFAYATNFKDSTIYLSAIQSLTGAVLQKKTGFLEHRSLYALQFKNHLEVTSGKQHFTSAILFSTNKKSLENKYLKMRQRIKKGKKMLLSELPLSDFTFIPLSSEEKSSSVSH